MDEITIILGAAFAVSKALALIPAVKASGIFQLIYNVLKGVACQKK